MRGTSVRDELNGLGGDDVLDGGLGGDMLSGGGGSDRATYANAVAAVTASPTDAASNTGEAAGDTYTSIENLTGSALNDTLTGNGGVNLLIGGEGNDTPTGGNGNDNFVFNTTLGAGNIDKINDFNFVNETIRLENSIFNAIVGTGVLSAAQFTAKGRATDSNDRIIYETDTGKLFYDSNRKAAGGSVQFTTLSPGLGISHTDFFII